MPMSSADPWATEGLIIDLTTGEYKSFLSFEPPSYGVDAEWDSQTVRGRVGLKKQYSHTGDETWNWSLALWASTDQHDAGRPEEVMEVVNFVKSFAYPDYRDSVVIAPHLAHIRLGKTIDAAGIIRSPQFNPQFPIDQRQGIFYGCLLTFSFEIEHDVPPSYQDIRTSRYGAIRFS